MAAIQDKNGSWSASISFYKDGKRRHTTKRGFSSKREAQRYELQFKDRLSSNDIKTVVKFKEALESFMTEKSTYLKASTQSEFARVSRDYFSMIMDRDIFKMSLNDYKLVKEYLMTKDLSVNYKNKIIGILKSVSKYISIHYEINDVARHIIRFRNNEINEEFSVWDINEFNIFQQYIDKEIYKYFFQTLFYTGARVGELRALYKSDYSNGYIFINKSLRHKIDGITTPKNKYSNRKIKLDSETDKIIKILSNQKGQFMFGNDKPLSESNVGREFRKYIGRVQLDYPEFRRIRVHDLRHSHATVLINNGANIVAVSKRLGHASIDITLRTYTHLLRESEDKLVEILNGITDPDTCDEGVNL